jgi:hypothetical protein
MSSSLDFSFFFRLCVLLAYYLLWLLVFFNLFNRFTVEDFLRAFFFFVLRNLFHVFDLFIRRSLLGLNVLCALFLCISCIFLFISSVAWSMDCCTWETKYSVLFLSCPPYVRVLQVFSMVVDYQITTLHRSAFLFSVHS